MDIPKTELFELLHDIHYLIPNTREAQFILRSTAEPNRLARKLHDLGAASVIVTAAEDGCFVAEGGAAWHQPAYKVEQVDTTGASDAFCAALAVSTAEGQPLKSAVQWATGAGALAVGRAGASSSMPERKALEEFLNQKD